MLIGMIPSRNIAIGFAVVAEKLEDRCGPFTTHFGCKGDLRIGVPTRDVSKIAHAMYLLKATVKRNEEDSGLEYDMDFFNIVVVPDFNMVTMENKSLNNCNSRLDMASFQTSFEDDYAAILSGIEHEYPHYWTSNMITYCDWLQLSLRENLTILWKQEFPLGRDSRTAKCMADVSRLEGSLSTNQNAPTYEKSKDDIWEFIFDSKAKCPKSTFHSARQKTPSMVDDWVYVKF